MKVKYYKVTIAQVWAWYMERDPNMEWIDVGFDIFKFIRELKSGSHQWHYKGVPLKLVD